MPADSHRLGRPPLIWYGPPELAEAARADFPRSMGKVPVLLPTQHAGVRNRLDQWFERHGLRPRIAGEFEYAALLAAFGASGMGVFPAAELVQDKLAQRYGLQRIGACDGVGSISTRSTPPSGWRIRWCADCSMRRAEPPGAASLGITLALGHGPAGEVRLH